MFKRIALFFALNILVLLTVSVVCSIFHIQPYLTAYGLDYQSLGAFCLIWGMAGAAISLALSRKMAKWTLGVTLIPVNTRDPGHQDLIDMVKTLSQRANIPMPEVGFYRSSEVNAFATGPTKKRSLIAVSSGLMQRMNKQEMEGVLAHEMAHIANGDMVTMTLLQGVVNAFVLFLSRIFAYALSGLGKNRGNNQNSGYMSFVLLTYLFEAVFMTLGFILVAAYSRFREFRADQGGAKLSGKAPMISALQSLLSLKESPDLQQSAAIAAFKISRSSKKGLFALFSTHPPLEERIARLQQ